MGDRERHPVAVRLRSKFRAQQTGLRARSRRRFRRSGREARPLSPSYTREDVLSYRMVLLTLPSTPPSDGDGHVRVRPNRTRNYPFSSPVRRDYHSSSGAVPPDAISCA